MAATKAFQVVLLDIEGTVCPISFVKDVLYPYSLRALPETLASKWDSPAFAPYRNAFPAEYRSSPDALTAHVHDLVAKDVKASYLKGLQGLLWEEGYRNGSLKAPLFADVLLALTRWHAAGVTLMIYSSGSVPAQKLLFAHTGVVGSEAEGGNNASASTSASTNKGKDLTPLLSDYFDTVNAGLKTVPASYTKILGHHTADHPTPSSWLFLSDNVLEVEAAQSAGMASYVVQRPGNASLAESVQEKHRVITSFDEIKF